MLECSLRRVSKFKVVGKKLYLRILHSLLSFTKVKESYDKILQNTVKYNMLFCQKSASKGLQTY